MKFSIVTPSFNSEKYIAETIESVISQRGNFEIEYIVVDNCSADETVDILREYERKIKDTNFNINCGKVYFRLISEKDTGMYSAINKGFSMATGDIYAWINSDDIYLQGAFDIVHKVFQSFQQVRWLKGITSYMNEHSTIYQAGRCFLYDQHWIQLGIYGRDAYFIQQESVFWRSDLWEKVEGIDERLKRAGDYALWIQFSQHAALYSVKSYLSCFRKVKGQISEDISSYKKEYEMIRTPKMSNVSKQKVRFFLRYIELVPVHFLKKLLYRVIFGKPNYQFIHLIDDRIPTLKSASYYIVE
jgi:glycosyltransferase involved in cell wall biosynthesis